MELIDTHAHIYLNQFKKDVDDVIARGRESGLSKILMPNIDHKSIDDMLELEHKYPDYCIPMMGLHPCSVGKEFEKELYLVEEWLNKKDFIAVGEIGTDLYWDKTFWEQQKEAFRVQVGFAKQFNIPIVIHCRESIDETIELVADLNDDDLTGIFHCFTGTTEQAERIIELGFSIGIGGVATFKNGGLDKVLPDVDISTIVLETDSPYLAPVPKRGKRNEPAYVKMVADRVAEIRQKENAEAVADITSQNAKKIFKL
ncbi:MAG: TatD family hydrolase [Bacteroidota bacterium]